MTYDRSDSNGRGGRLLVRPFVGSYIVCEFHIYFTLI